MWSGSGWPKWFPPAEMIAREPELEKYSEANGGMPPGLDNPLGARALYIFQDGKDTLFRVHGSPEWSSIGRSVSSGCVRLMNQDIIDLYGRVPEKSPIVVAGGPGSFEASQARMLPVLTVRGGQKIWPRRALQKRSGMMPGRSAPRRLPVHDEKR